MKTIEDVSGLGSGVEDDQPADQDVVGNLVSGTFSAWRDRWTALAAYSGPTVADFGFRIEQLAILWREPVPGVWQRGVDQQLMKVRYRRGNRNKLRRGEHIIEYEILCEHFDEVSCYGSKLVDGVNEFPLSRDTAGGGRVANVSADILLLAEREGAYHQFLCEIKDNSNDPWYATVESLRQLRLFLSSPQSRSVFQCRGFVQGLPPDIPVTAVIMAPSEYFSSPGKKKNAVKPALELINRFAWEFELDIRLAVWNPSTLEIEDLDAAALSPVIEKLEASGRSAR